MKKIIMLLLAILLLCSCAKEPPKENPAETPTLSEEDIENFNSSEETIPEEPKEEIDPVKKASVAEVRGMWLDHVRDDWKKDGFTATPGNVMLLDNGVFSYSFTIKTESTIFSFHAYGTISYKEMESFSPEKQADHILATWGTNGIYENGIR